MEVKVLAGVPATPSSESSDNDDDSILFRAASRLDLAAREIAISNGGGGGGGGGLWMKDSALTGRADEHVLLQAGASALATGGE